VLQHMTAGVSYNLGKYHSLFIMNNRTIRTRAQLSQRDHAMLCVTEYFAKSLKVI